MRRVFDIRRLLERGKVCQSVSCVWLRLRLLRAVVPETAAEE